MQEIDLGDDVKVKVKYKGKDYELREPTVQEIEAIADGGSDQMKITSFLNTLGMPLDVVRSMGASRGTKLVEGIMELVTKKK